MMVLVAYDINTASKGGAQRLRRIEKACRNLGQRVQNSMFECLVDPAQWTALRNQLLEIMNSDKDSLRFYFLGRNWKRRVEHVGAKSTYDPEGPIIL